MTKLAIRQSVLACAALAAGLSAIMPGSASAMQIGDGIFALPESMPASAQAAPFGGSYGRSDHMRLQVVRTARKYLGTPYVFGARYGQTDTFDCSSFAKTVYAELSVHLPRVSRDQAKLGNYVARSELKVGDLVFFRAQHSGTNIGHVGIYAGDGQMIHTYGEGGVKYSRIDKGYWSDRYVTARRVLPD